MTKCICIKDQNVHGYRFPITEGRMYDVTKTYSDQNGKYIDIIDDRGRKSGYPAIWFISIEMYRDKKLEELGI
jgi:hypothetical protein